MLKDLYQTKLKQTARMLRKNQTEAERILWSHLRNGRLGGYKFRRQFPIGNYVLDFFCYEKKLAIELDGGHHAQDEQKEYDRIRTLHLENYDIKVLRFWNSEVKKSKGNVLQYIFYNLTN